MEVDWRDPRRRDRIRVEMVSPTNLDDIYGELEGIDLSGSSLSAAYYTDTRTSGMLSVVGDGWVRGSFLRIIHEAPDQGYSNTLGTYLVVDDDATEQNGIWHYTLELQSMLYALVTEKARRPWTIAKGAGALKTIKQILESSNRKYISKNAKDYTMSSPLVMESGQTMLSRIFALSQLSGNRIDVDCKGYVTIEPYILPDKKIPKLTLDLADPRGVVSDGVSRSTDWLKMPTEAVVSYKYTTQVNGKSVEQEINSWATVSADNHASRSIRGYVVTDFRTVSDMSPQTQAQADRLAKEYLAGDSKEHVTWNIETSYIPVWEGDVVELVVHDGLPQYTGTRKCLVKSVELGLQFMKMRITLKETASGDDDE